MHVISHSLRKNCPYSEIFWSVFSRIRPEYGDLLRIDLLIQSECGKIWTGKSPNTDTFHAVIGGAKLMSSESTAQEVPLKWLAT